MAIRFTRENDAGSTGKRHIVVTVSPATFIGLSTVALLCFVWVFVFGLIVGRGYQPEETVPELKQFMPSAGNSESANGSAAPSESANQAAQTSSQTVIKPEDLNFYEQLKKDSAATRKPNKPNKPKPVTTVTKPATASPLSQTTPELPTKYDKPAADKPSEGFNYIYQVAAFKDKAAANAMKGQIEAKGLRARVDSADAGGVTWFRIMVLFRGTPEDTQKMKDTLQTLKITKPLLKSKDPL